MPEGHSVFIAARDHNALLAGHRLAVSSPQGRFDAAAVDGTMLTRVEAAGKHLFYHFTQRRRTEILHVHLGRLGRFKHHTGTPPPPGAACRLRLTGGGNTVDLSGPTACHVISAEARAGILARLGPDPLRPDAIPADAWEKIHRSRKAIGALLLDQSVIAGLGNIFRAEILFRLGLDPRVAGTALTRAEFDRVWAESMEMLKRGVKYRWIVTTEPSDIGKPLSRATTADRFYVYRRPHCRRCGGEVRILTLASRDHYFCPKCQSMQRPGTGAKKQKNGKVR